MRLLRRAVLALVLLVMSLSVPAAAAETITVNVTNTPVRGSVALEPLRWK